MLKIKNSYGSISDYINYHWKRDNSAKLREIRFADGMWCISDDVIGKGDYASIHLAIPSKYVNNDFHQLIRDGNLMAVKKFYQKGFFQERKNVFEMYYKLHSQHYPAELRQKNLASITTQNNGAHYLLLPLFPGSLEDFHTQQFVEVNGEQKPKYFSPVNSIVAIIACLRALIFFHSSDYIHLDIKASNIQYDEILEKATVIDPDFAKNNGRLSELKITDKIFGSPGYQAPEIYTTIPPAYSFRVDYYAMAGLIIELLGNTTDEMLYQKAKQRRHNIKAVTAAPYSFSTEHLKKHFSDDEITDLDLHIKNLCNNDPMKRPENLHETVQFFENLLDGWLNRHKLIHQEKMKHVVSQLSNRFFKNIPAKFEEQKCDEEVLYKSSFEYTHST